MAEENKGCSLAVHLAMASLRGNEEMMQRLIDMANQMNADYLFHDMLEEGVDFGLDGEALRTAREYTLKGQSVEMKFKALLFSGVLANTVQGDEALQAMFDAIKETGGTIAEGMDLLGLAAKMDLSQFEDVAKVLGADVETAKKFTEEARKKISDYIASEYSVISTGTTVKPSKLKPKIEKRLAKSKEYVEAQKESLGDAYKDVNKDLKRLQSKPKSAVNYWSKKEGREELQKLQEKYKTKSASKRDIEAKLSKIKNAEDTVKNSEKELQRLDDEYKKALEEDLKAVKDNQNPYNYVGADAEWKFNKEFNNNISNRVLEYGQYALARTLLTSDSVLPQSVYTALVKLVKSYAGEGVTNTSGTKITEDWVLDSDRTLDELLAAAYINTKQLCDDGQLRMLYRQRLISLASDGALSMDDVSLVNTMMETLRFSGEGAGFSDILKYSMLKDNANELLGRGAITLNGKGLRDNIVDIFKRDDFDNLINSGDTITLNDGSKITTRQLLELVTTMTNEVSLYKLIASNDFTDKQILDIAGEYLVGNAEEGRQKIMNLVNVVRKNPTTDDTRGIILKALTGKNVSKETPVGFFDFRRGLNATDDVKARAEFRDRLAEANKIYIPDTGIRDLTTTNESQLIKELEGFRGGYLLVTDSQRGLNKTLTNALDKINYKNGKLVDEKERVVVIFPSKGLMGRVGFEKGKLLFKTSYSGVYDAFLRKIAMRTISDSGVDSKLSKEIINTIQYGGSTAEENINALSEFNKALEKDAKAYFGAMIGEDPLSDRLPALLEQRTGISFKNYDAIMNKAEFWRMVDEKFMLGMKLMGNYDQELVTIADVIRQVDSMTPAEIASDLSAKYGFEIPEYRIADGKGKVRKEVRNAYLNYNLAETHIELLERKGKLLAVINGGVADNITINQFKSMWQSKNFSAYKDIFFHDLDLADEELNKHIKAINDMVFEGLCLQFADNLVAMGYSLPLVNVRDLVYDYLNGKLNVNGDFARAFLYKNNLPDTISTLSGIVNEAMPDELRFGYDDMVEKYEVGNHGSQSFHTIFKTSFSGSGEGGAAHGAGVYITKESPDRSTGYALLGHKNTTYKGRTREELKQDNAFIQEVGEGYSIINSIMDDLKYRVNFNSAVGKAERALDRQMEEARILSSYVDADDNAHLIERINKKREFLNSLDEKDFYSPGIELSKKREKGAQEVKWRMRGNTEVTSQDLLEMSNKQLEKGNNYTAAKYFALSEITKNLLGGEPLPRGEMVPDWTFKTFNFVVDRSIDVIHSYVEAGLITEAQFDRLAKSLRKLEITDFSVPGFGQYGYFYKLEFPDYIKEGANTPTGRNYLDMRIPVYMHGKFQDINSIRDISSKFIDFAKENGIRFRSTGGRPEHFILMDAIEEWAASHSKHQKFHSFKDLPPHSVDEEDLYDIVAGFLNSKEKASQFFNELGYKGLSYVGGRDGESFVIYNGDDVKPLVIYDNRYKTPIWEAPGLNKEKYKAIQKRFDETNFHLGEVEEVVDDVMRAGDISLTEESVVNITYRIYETILHFLTGQTSFKTVEEMADYTLGWSGQLLNDSQKLRYNVFKKIKDGTALSAVLEGASKQIDELSNFDSPSVFEALGGRRWGIGSGKTISFEEALLIKSFVGDRTVAEIADAYGLPINLVNGLVTPEGLEALGRFGYDGISLVKSIKESTAPHELFHGIFRAVDDNTRIAILNKAQELYGFSYTEAEEMLADKFSEYFRTGSFSLPKEAKGFKSQIEKFFKKIKAWLLGIEEYEGTVRDLFDDMIGLKYIDNEIPTTADQITRMVEVKNPFMTDTYSTLVAMAVVKDGGLMVNAGAERQVLKGILDDYYNAVKQATEGGKTLSFSEAQKLKTKAGYALDMFEQNYISPRYKQFLTPEEKNQLFGLKYTLGVATNADSLETIAEYNNKILNRYDSSVKNIIDTNNDIKSLVSPNNNSINEEIEKRSKELIQQGATMKVVGGDVIVVDTREELLNQIRNMPDGVMGLEVFKTLGREGLNQLSNEQAYFLLQLVELARNADNKMNMISGTIYKLNPQLAKIDFFNTYKVENGLPKALGGNLLERTDFLSKFTNTSTFDDNVKRNIFERIKNAFAENGKLGYYKKKLGKKVYVDEYEHLQEIISDAIDSNVKDLANSIKGSDLNRFRKESAYVYTNAFSPYTVLKDVPTDTKKKIDEILTTQQKGIIEAMDLLGENNRLISVMDSISITTADGEVKSLSDVLNGDEPNLSKLLFDTDTNIVKSADELAAQKIDQTLPEKDRLALEAENEKLVKAQENNYNDALTAYLNNSEIVSQSERELLTRLWGSARQVAKKYTLTNKLAETDNALAGLNESIIRGFKADILGFKGNVTAGGQLFGGSSITDNVMERWKEVKKLYRNLYSMSYNQLARYQAKSELDEVALNLAKYFKEIERRCGSIDGITGATTSQEVNRAFAHLGEVVLNINSIHGLFSLMSGVEGNQILKFFRFSEPGQLSRVNELVIGNVGDYWVGGYRNYVDKTDEGLNREWFNKTFGANFDKSDYQKLIQALCGFTVVSKKMKWLMNTLNFINSSNYLTRALLSYPGQFLTIGNQTIAYFLKQKGWERELGAEDLGTVDKIRKSSGILNGAYNELNVGEFFKKLFSKINPDSTDPNAYYNRYGIPDVDDLMSKEKFYTSDDITTLYSKIDNYGADDKLISWSKFMRNTDAYKDNANNIIDGLYARNYKNIAFIKALQSNRYMTFATAEQYARFMASDAPGEMKQKLLDAIASEAGKNFRNILGLGFSGLDRATGGGWLKNIFVSLGQMFNFRGAWGQNIARQTSNWIITAIKMARKGLSKEGRDAVAEYIAKQPEFINFTTQLFNDLHNMWRLVKYQDNGDYLPEWDEYSLMDFLEYSYETMQFSSQWRQGIQSYGPTRILTAWVEGAEQTYKNPEIYKDTLGIGALMNAISKNLGRNWKLADMFAKGVAVAQSRGWNWDVITEFLSNEFWKLSFGSLRYLMNEDETNYGYSTELINGGAGGIPFIISGESDVDGDKAYSYDMAGTETWLNLINWRNAKRSGDNDAAREYLLNNIDSFYNSSQMFNFVKNIGRAVAGSDWVGDKIKDWLSDGVLIGGRIYPMGSPFDLAEGGEKIRETDAGNTVMKGLDYIPTDVEDIKILMDEVMGQASHRPGNDGFNKSMFNFDESGHMKNLEESNEADASMELLLTNMKYKRDSDFNFVLDEKGNKIVNPEWDLHMKDMQLRFNDEDYMTISNYNFINSWVERNNKDPNYMLYKRLLAEGVAGRYADQELQKQINRYNKAYGLKGDYKVTKTKLQESHKNYSEIYANLPSVVSTITGKESSFLESLIELDRPATNRAYIKMIERQLAEKGDNETMRKFFNIDKDGNINLSSKYENYIEEQARLGEMLRAGDLDGFIAETASITKMFEKEDPYGLATATLISSRIHRINQAENLSAEQKAKTINTLMSDNYEFVQQHIPELISELGENANVYVDQMNNSLYDISLIGDLLTYQNEMKNSKSGRSNSISISGMAKDLLAKLGKSTGSGNGVGGGKKYDYNIIPVKLDGAKLLKATGGKGYTPKTASAAIEAYTPHADFSVAKDVNRKISGPKTQAVTKKKQLSKLESDVEKALEAES